MIILNCTQHIRIRCSSNAHIVDSDFTQIRSYEEYGGAIYANSSFELSVVNTIFDDCVAESTSGGIFSNCSKCTLNKVCFNCCYQIQEHDGSSAILERGETIVSFVSIHRCPPKDNCGPISFRTLESKTTISNVNSSSCSNHYASAFSPRYPFTGSSMKFVHVIDMSDRALQLDYSNNLTCSKCNIVNNTKNDCYGIYIISISQNDAITFREFVLWGNSGQIKDEKEKAIHYFIKCTSDSNFGTFRTSDCLTNVNSVEFYDVKAPSKCGGTLAITCPRKSKNMLVPLSALLTRNKS